MPPPPPRPSGICKSCEAMIPDNMDEIKDRKVKFKKAKGKKAQNSFLGIVEWPMMKESQSCPILAVSPSPASPLHLSGPHIPHLHGERKTKNLYLDRLLVVLVSRGSGIITKLLPLFLFWLGYVLNACSVLTATFWEHRGQIRMSPKSRSWEEVWNEFGMLNTAGVRARVGIDHLQCVKADRWTKRLTGHTVETVHLCCVHSKGRSRTWAAGPIEKGALE